MQRQLCALNFLLSCFFMVELKSVAKKILLNKKAGKPKAAH